MRVALVKPNCDVYRRFKLGKRTTKLPPLGLMYLASVLEREGHEVMILDAEAKGLSMEETVSRTLEWRPELVGVGPTTPEMTMANDFLERIKNDGGEVVTVAGGFHPSALPEETLERFPSIDFVIKGEGEYTLAELVSHLESGKPGLGEIDGLYYRENGTIRKNRPREPILHLDELPFPARHLIDPEEYLMPVPQEGLVRNTMIQTSRGCPYRCIFCYRSKDPANLRARSPENVLDELQEAVEKYSVRSVFFADDTFTFSKKRTEKIVEGMMERGIDIRWYCLARADTVDEELLRKMKKAGLVELSMGVETGNQKMLDMVGKHTTLEKYREAYRIAKKVGVVTRGSFIIGLPYETRETIRQTIDFAKSLDLDAAFFNIATPYPGSVLGDMAFRGEGLRALTNDWEEYQRWGGAVIELDGISPEELVKWQKRAMLEFYLRPKIIFHHLVYLVQARQFLLGYLPNPLGIFSSLFQSLRPQRSPEKR
ncbi:MAG: radical SAM protein [Thermoplasmata archaeon]|nr:radical SAM protein [Thermoplasmata archaeon]